MASYYQGYTAPSGYNTRNDIKALQQQLNAQGAGLQVDGIYGPKTNAAYQMYGGAGSTGGTQSYIPSDYKSILQEVQSMLQPATMSYNGLSREDIEAGLRPTFDIAIQGRRGQTKTNKANIDADAASRGMGSSTWVTDVKDRQQNAEASDIGALEAGYAQQLMAALQQENQNKLAVDQFNAQAKQNALQSALSLSGDLYGQRLNQAQQVQQQSRGGGSGKSNDISALLNEAQQRYGYLGNAINNIASFSTKYTTDAINAAKKYLSDEYVAANTNYGYK